MKIGGRQIMTVYRNQTGRLPLPYIFLAGALLGVILMSAGKKFLLTDSGLLGEEALYHMKYMTVDESALFWYVSGIRIKHVAILVVLATTYLGLAVVCTMSVWYGMSAGMFLTAVILRYGLKGFLLAVVGVVPQYLFYIPAFYFLLGWCEQTCRGIYFEKTASFLNKQQLLIKFIQLLLIILVVITGCVLESYVNPDLLGGLLKIF